MDNSTTPGGLWSHWLRTSQELCSAWNLNRRREGVAMTVLSPCYVFVFFFHGVATVVSRLLFLLLLLFFGYQACTTTTTTNLIYSNNSLCAF